MSPAWVEPGIPLLAAAVPAALMGLLLCFAVRITPRGITRRRLACPLLARDATVDFVVEDDGGDTCADVVACSLVPGGCEIACGKPCRSTGVASFGC
jgi:hypothetical protein